MYKASLSVRKKPSGIPLSLCLGGQRTAERLYVRDYFQNRLSINRLRISRLESFST